MIVALLTTLAMAATPAEQALEAGMAHQKAGNADEAIQAYRSCLEADAAMVRCHWELGWSQWTKADWPGVVASWSRVQELDPAWPELDKWLPMAKTHLDNANAARAALEAAPDSVGGMPAGKTLRLRAVGDVMLGTDFPAGYMPPDDGARLLDAVSGWLRDADVTFGNLEGPLCDGGETRKCGSSGNCYAFRTPTRYGAYLEASGFDLMSTANNHSGDFGELCRRQTEAALDRHGIAWSGPPGSVATVERAGVRIGMVAFHTSPACNYINDHDNAAELVKLAKAKHDVVVVSFHGGAEGTKALHVPDEMELFYGEKRGHLRKFVRAVIGAGADVVFGHGPHVPRGMEVIDGHLAIYSLGNFATYGRFNLSGHLATSMVLEVELDHEGKLVRGKILPVKQVGEGVPEQDLTDKTAIGLLRQLSEADFPGTAPVIAADGTFAPKP